MVRWWTRLPLTIRLTTAWVKWALGVVAGTFMYGLLFLALGVSALALLLLFLGLPLPQSIEGAVLLVTFGLAFVVALWVTERPKVCQQCGCVQSRLWE